MKTILSLVVIAVFFFSGCTLSKPKAQTNVNEKIPVKNIESPAKETPTQEPNKTIENEVLTKEPTANMLNLSNQKLDKVPDSVFKQTDLEILNLSSNKLTGALQAEIRHLKNLKVLNASDNLMTGVPAEIGQLVELQTLDLSNNQLTGLPHELGNLKNLKILNISGNDYSALDLGIIEKALPTDVKIIK